jgi:hypothetical protein
VPEAITPLSAHGQEDDDQRPAENATDDRAHREPHARPEAPGRECKHERAERPDDELPRKDRVLEEPAQSLAVGPAHIDP